MVDHFAEVLISLSTYLLTALLKKLIRFLECSWNHEFFGSLAKQQETRSIHDFMNIPKFELIAYIYISLYITNN